MKVNPNSENIVREFFSNSFQHTHVHLSNRYLDLCRMRTILPVRLICKTVSTRQNNTIHDRTEQGGTRQNKIASVRERDNIFYIRK
jgi:hypothetical protein